MDGVLGLGFAHGLAGDWGKTRRGGVSGLLAAGRDGQRGQ
jgi:hypothetical protein